MSDPSTILGSDLVAWYKRGTGVYDQIVGGNLLTPASTNNTEVGRWEDQSGNANHATRSAAIGTGHLQWSTSVTKNGFPTVVLLASSTCFVIPDAVGTALNGAGAGTVWTMLKATAKNSTTASGLWNFSSSGSGTNYGWSDNHIYEGWGTSSRKDSGIQIVDIAADFRAYSVASATNDWTNYLDNSQQFHTATNTVSFRTTGLRFGLNQANLPMGAWVSELVVAKVKASGTQLTNMQTYLSTASGSGARSFAALVF